MTVLRIEGITKSFADKTVLDDVSFHIGEGECVGLVGANGAGKSTLVHILTGLAPSDEGRVVLKPGTEIGYLPQTFGGDEDITVGEWLARSQQSLRDMASRLQAAADAMATQTGRELEAVMAEYGELSTRFEQRGGYELDYRIEQVMNGLGLAHINGGRSLGSLSGGEKRRLGLASLLIGAPDLLILDEPTNHLDGAALTWLEQFLQAYRGAALLVSHDRRFLNQCVNRIVELDEYDHKARDYAGNYDDYVQQKDLERKQWQLRYQAQQDEIRHLNERIREAGQKVGGHDRPMKDHHKMAYYRHGLSVEQAVSRNVRAAQVQLERILANPVPPPPQPLQFTPALTAERAHAPWVVSVTDLTVALDDGTLVLDNVRLSLGRSDRVLITGPNGSGKSTLLHALVGRVQLCAGNVLVPSHVRIGFLPQEVDLSRCPGAVLDAFRDGLPGERDEHVAKLLSLQLFRYEEFAKPVRVLSAGQWRKLLLARLLSQPVGLLLIDEPTNHLSFDVVAQLEAALDRFTGPVIAVSHDRWFIDHFRGTRYELANGRLAELGKSRVSEATAQDMVSAVRELSQYEVTGRRGPVLRDR